MEFIQAQFSLKYEQQIKIRRYANEIEDFLQCYYGIPQTTPLPDEIAPDAPRIVLYSKNGHSQIHFSQVSVDFIVNFDNDFLNDFEKTKKYITERIILIIDLLRNIDINEYLYLGITYNAHLVIGNRNPIEYIKEKLGGDFPQSDVYEISQNVASVKENRFFVNEQIGTYKEFQRKFGETSNPFKVVAGEVVSEGISLSLDINNRYQYIYQKKKNSISECLKDIDTIFSLLVDNINRWE